MYIICTRFCRQLISKNQSALAIKQYATLDMHSDKSKKQKALKVLNIRFCWGALHTRSGALLILLYALSTPRILR